MSRDDLLPAACSQCRGEIPPGATYCPHCGARQEATPAHGPSLAGYTILRPLGSGGAADVYLGRQDALDRPVAIKVLRHDVDDSRQWRRFRREAQTIARLSAHPHVVTVHTAGRAETGQPYLVTEFLDRGSLGDVLASEGPLSPERAARVGVAVADALLAAHALGILHRDVKPANVLLGQDGQIKLGDFGIARLLEARAGTTTDVIAFTPEHVAPELLRGEPDGPWSDVYGLASTVAAALLGRSIFRMGAEERVDTFLSRKVTAPPPALPSSVPPVLARPLAAALDPDPHRRPSLPELRDQLAAATEELAHEGSGAAVATAVLAPDRDDPKAAVPAAPAPASRPPRRPPRPERGASSWTKLVALAAAALLAGALVAIAAGLFSDDDDGDATTTSATVPATATVTAPPATTTLASAAPPPPSTAATAPPATPGPLLTPPEAERYLTTYYDAVAAGEYEQTWAQLAPEFQRGTARSFTYYAQFWDDNDVELGAIELVEASADRAVVNAELRWNGSSTPTVEQFTLRPGDAGTILIAEQQTVSG